MKKFALYINSLEEVLNAKMGFKQISEENVFNDFSNYQDKYKTTLFYQQINNENAIYSITDFLKINKKVKEERSIQYLNALIENVKDIVRMKKTVCKRGNDEFVVSYEHPLLKTPLFFYFVKGDHSEALYKSFLSFFNLSVDLTNFSSFSEKAILMLNEENYGMTKIDLARDVLGLIGYKVNQEQLKVIEYFLYEVDMFKEKEYGYQKMSSHKLTESEYLNLSKSFKFNLDYKLFKIIEVATQEIDYSGEPLDVYLPKLFQFTFEKIDEAYCLNCSYNF